LLPAVTDCHGERNIGGLASFEKSGTYALAPKNGKVVWKTDVGPAGAILGGIEWGTAIVGDSLYWGSGYALLGPAVRTGNSKLFAFTID
jgi:hypothetical protein